MASLILAVGVLGLAVYIPGTLFFRALGFTRLVAAICAPLYSVAAISTLPIVYYPLGIHCDALSVYGPTLAIAVVAWALASRLGKPDRALLDVKRSKRAVLFGRKVPFEYLALLAYLATGFTVAFIVLHVVADSVDSFMPYNDNKTHLNLMRAFLDSGKWSSLHASRFIASGQNAASAIIPPASFYPAAMHDLTALVCCMLDVEMTVAYHAVLLMFLIVTLPTSMLLFMKALFGKSRHIVASGAVISASFSAYPWPALLLYGPITPFFISAICLVPVMALVLLYIENRLVKRKLPSFIVSCALSAVTLALTQTSALFAAYVFFGAYACHLLGRTLDKTGRLRGVTRGAAKAACELALAAALLGLLFLSTKLPFLQGVVNYSGTKYLELPDTLYRLATLGFHANEPQFLLAAIALVGIFESFRTRRIWFLASALYMALAYIGLSTESEPLHSLNWLSGFWYHIWHRVGMLCALFLIPSTSLGLSLISRLVMVPLRVVRKKPLGTLAHQLVVVVLLVAMFAAIVVSGYGAFEKLQRHLRVGVSNSVSRAYPLAESWFVDKVVDEIPENALVLNDPNDGSVFSYGVNGLNTYYRQFSSGTYTDDAKLIKKSLAKIASDESVREAVRRTGAEYVVLLDQGVPFEKGQWPTGTTASILEGYSGINGITDNTPGFDLVLAEDDMRLYRILV